MPGRPRLADSVSRFLFDRAPVRGAVVDLDRACGEILRQHPYPPALSRALAELLAAAALLASMLKFEGALIVQLQGTGPVRLLVVECDAALNLRATAQWSRAAETLPADAPLSALAGDSAESRLAITLDPKDGGALYQGIVALEAASIATLVEHYLATSEQIASRMIIAADGAHVRGLLLQRLPIAGHADEPTWQRAAQQVEAVTSAALLGADSAETLLAATFPADDIRVQAALPARFRCACSEERVANTLRMLGRGEVESILSERGEGEVTCEFCQRRYRFAAAEALALFESRPRRHDAPPRRAPH